MLTIFSFLILAGYIFYEEYDGEIQGQESGERVSDKEPFCGRYSLKNPTIIFKAGYSGFFGISAMTYRISKYKEVSRRPFLVSYEYCSQLRL